ncbi:MAG: hypothetical protein HY231_07820 [Acidobacteria bacterium]|nr:hypothetical protein [Acidobacteriota bacterium]
MITTTGKFFAIAGFAFALLLLSQARVLAQVEKGTKEILVFSSSFTVVVKEPELKVSESDGTVGSGSTSNFRNFNIGGKFGYFLSQRNEVGGGANLNVSHFKFCSRLFQGGKLVSESCDSNTHFSMGVSGFYRYNFADKDDKRFPFIGTELQVLDVANNFTGNFRLRPQVGYKYFLNRNVALDFSLGYTIDVNEKKDHRSSFNFEQGRRGTIDGQLGLTFVF